MLLGWCASGHTAKLDDRQSSPASYSDDKMNLTYSPKLRWAVTNVAQYTLCFLASPIESQEAE